MGVNRYPLFIKIICFILLLGLLIYGNFTLFSLAYIAVFVFASARSAILKAQKRTKFSLLVSYGTALAFQMAVNAFVVFGHSGSLPDMILRRLFGVVILVLPLVVSRYLSVGKHAQFYLPSLQEMTTISFSELHSYKKEAAAALAAAQKMGESLSADNLAEIITDLPRHDSFRYISNGSLTDEYFAEAEKTLSDPYIYIIISNTGSAASEVISVFTRKQFNHASLAFEPDLKTIISYNGGEKVYPPGLNKEMIGFFNKKPDASIIVYKLPCTRGQKEMIIAKIREINQTGSAYNMLGLVLKYSHKPNIMFCSQFVYQMLKFSGLAYFDAKDALVQPTDLVELDYYRKLLFAYEIKLSGKNGNGL